MTWRFTVECPNGHKWQVPMECERCPSDTAERDRPLTWRERRALRKAIRLMERGH